MQQPREGRFGGALLVGGLGMVFVVLSLGASLVGLRAFAATDLIGGYAPWSAVGPEVIPADRCHGDTVDSVIPGEAVVRRDLAQGGLGQWNPLVSGGAPLASVPSLATWSPLSLPYLLLPTWLAPAWSKLLELLLTVGGMYLLLRRLALRRGPSLLGGLAFATSGFMVAWTNWPQTRTAAFIPLLLWAIERLVQVRTARALLPVAASVAGLFLGGFPAVAAWALYLAAAYLLVRLVATRAGQPRLLPVRTALLAGAGVALGAMVVAFQLFPFAAQLGDLDIGYRQQLPRNHLPGLALATAVLPKAFGSCYGDYVGQINGIETNAYLGSVVVVLAVVALLRTVAAPRGARAFFAASALVVVVLVWVGGPLLALAQQLPVFSNNPVARLNVLLGLCVSVLAAMGYDALLAAREQQGRRRWWPELLVWAAAAAGALYVYGQVADYVRTKGGDVGRLEAHATRVLLITLLVVPCIALARTRYRRLVLGVIPLAVVAQGISVATPLWPQVPREQFYPSTPVHEFLRAQLGGERFQGTDRTMLPGTNAYYGLRSLGGHAFTAPTWRELMETADPKAFKTPTYSFLRPGREIASRPALDRFAVRYLVNESRAEVWGARSTLGTATGTMRLAPGAQVEVRYAGGPLRAIAPQVAQSPYAEGMLRVEVRDGDRVLARSARRLRRTSPGGAVTVAVAGERLPRRPSVVRVTNGTDRGLVLRTTSSGDPVLQLTRPQDDGFALVQGSEYGTVWQRLTALPRVRWASDVVLAKQGAASLRAAGSTPARPGQVVLEADPARAAGAPAEVEVRKDRGSAVEATVRAQGSGYLVVADGLQSGWRATVDGRDAPLLDADHALVAVPVPKGRHTVRLSYQPAGRGEGVVVSLVALTALGLVAVWRRRPDPAVADQPGAVEPEGLSR